MSLLKNSEFKDKNFCFIKWNADNADLMDFLN
jgi:hypothetical protein